MTTAAPPVFTIDTARPSEAEALARVHVRGWEVAYGHLLAGEQWFGQEAIERRTRQWTSWLTPGTHGADQGMHRVGRDAEGAVIGLAASWPPRDPQPAAPPELSVLYIDEAWFGTGLGRALAEAILEGGPAGVWVAEQNPRARRFYEKLGFALDGTARVEEQLGNLRDLHMVR